jgi:hypothetical protein
MTISNLSNDATVDAAGVNSAKRGTRMYDRVAAADQAQAPVERTSKSDADGRGDELGTAVVSGRGSEGAVVATEPKGFKARTLLRARLGDEIFNSWFNSLEIDGFEDGVVKASVNRTTPMHYSPVARPSLPAPNASMSRCVRLDRS